jgi:hypothetical protein
MPNPSRAQLPAELQESTVRIICPTPAENGAKGFKIIQLHLSSGQTANAVGYSAGTGFVINDEGVIVTNNHVVAPEPLKDVPSPLVMVMQKIGKQYILHKATVLWQSPNGDLGIIQAPSLKAKPFPIEFDDSKSTPSEEVYSMGYPGITDLAEEDFDRSSEIRKLLIENKANYLIHERENQQHRRLPQSEIDEVFREVASKQAMPAGDWMEFLAHLGMFLQNADSAAPAWDVTEVIGQNSLWADYFRPTVTKGNIEKIAKIHGFLGVSHPDVLMFQHNCAIKHGNSGGPLLNGGGQVIGVVGRGEWKMQSGDREDIKWATAAGELKDWLESHKVNYIPAGEWRKTPEQPVKIIEQSTLKVVERLPTRMLIAIALAVAVAIGAAVLGLIRARQSPSFTAILRDPRMAKILGTTQSKLLASDGARSQRPPSAPSSSGDKWQLVGRTPNGDQVHVEITETMFANNDDRLILGRTAELCHVVVNDDSISKQHAHLRKDGRRFLVADRNSSNRTAVNGKFNSKVFDEVPIQEGDTLTLGDVRLDFSKA